MPWILSPFTATCLVRGTYEKLPFVFSNLASQSYCGHKQRPNPTEKVNEGSVISELEVIKPLPNTPALRKCKFIFRHTLQLEFSTTLGKAAGAREMHISILHTTVFAWPLVWNWVLTLCLPEEIKQRREAFSSHPLAQTLCWELDQGE